MRASTLMPTMNFMTRFYRNPILPGRLISENILKALPILLTAGVLFITTACEENPSKIGAGLLPGSDYVTIKSDSMAVKSYTMYNDSVRSENPAISYLGDIYDPYFGTTTSGFVSQLWLNTNMTNEDFIAVDSVKLYLRLLTVKGDTISKHTLKMSEISQRIYDSLPYYSNQTVPLTGDEWNIELPTLRADTINDIVVTIPNTFGEHLTRDKSMLFMKDSSDKKVILPDFRSYFAGLSFQLDPSANPVFVSLSVYSVGSTGTPVDYFTVYTHNGVQVSSSYDFLLGARHVTPSFNLFKHDFSTADADKKIQHINDGYADKVSYLQNMNGVYTRIDIPFLKAMKSDPNFKNVAINKARLIIPFVVDTTKEIIFAKTIPSIVYLRYIINTGYKHYKQVVQDYLDVGATFYDGKPDTVTSMSYNINLAAYLQKYLNDATDTITPSLELFLLSTSEYNAILAANNNPKRVKFEFTYTKF